MSDFPITINRHLIPETEFFEAAKRTEKNCTNCGIGGKPHLIVYREGFAEPLIFCSDSCAAEHFINEVEFKDA